VQVGAGVGFSPHSQILVESQCSVGVRGISTKEDHNDNHRDPEWTDHGLLV